MHANNPNHNPFRVPDGHFDRAAEEMLLRFNAGEPVSQSAALPQWARMAAVLVPVGLLTVGLWMHLSSSENASETPGFAELLMATETEVLESSVHRVQEVPSWGLHAPSGIAGMTDWSEWTAN